MACAAAVEAVRRELVPAPGRRTAVEIFHRVNWWTAPTIHEALNELIERKECLRLVKCGVIVYRLRPSLRIAEKSDGPN